MASLGGGSTQSQGTSSGSTFIDASQQGFLDFLRNQGQSLVQQQTQAGGIGDQATQAAQQLGQQGQNFLDIFSQGAQGQLQGQQAQQQAANQAISGQGPGGQFLSGAVQQGNPFLNSQIQSLGQQIGQNFQNQILPGLQSGANQVGGLGGGRHQIAQGLAAQGAQQAFGQGAAALGSANFGQQLGAAQALQGGALQGGALAGQGVSQQFGAGQAGLGSLGGLFNLGQAPFQQAFNPLQNFAGLVGAPTVLSQNQGQNTSSGFNFNAGLG